MGIAVRPKYLKRYKDFAGLLIKYGKSELIESAGLENILSGGGEKARKNAAVPLELPADLQRLGPTYVKLGQFLSTRADLLPPEYQHALASLQDDVQPIAFQTIRETISAELGVRISKAFRSFEERPLAAASLGQVHLAWLRDGRRVAVKVQRPAIRETILDDLQALSDVTEFMEEHTEMGRKMRPHQTLGEFRKALLRELDFENEARHLLKLGENLREFKNIMVPEPVFDYTTARVLTMEYVSGEKITDLSPLSRLELDGGRLAEELFRAYLQQILVDGFFHADPHPGNVFITDDHQLALLDLGMVAWLTESLRERLLRFFIDVSEGRGEEAARHVMEMSEVRPEFQRDNFYGEVVDLVSKYQDLSINQIEVGRVVMEVTRISIENGIHYPKELSMLGKTLLNLDKIGRTLDPDFNPNESIRRNAMDLFQKKLRGDFSLQGMLNSMMETKDFLTKLPGQLNAIVRKFSRGELEVKIDAIDERYLMTAFQKIANRLTLGMILAAMIVGAALIMDIKSSFTIFGYPGLAILFFMISAIGGLILMLKIIFQDEPSRRKK